MLSKGRDGGTTGHISHSAVHGAFPGPFSHISSQEALFVGEGVLDHRPGYHGDVVRVSHLTGGCLETDATFKKRQAHGWLLTSQ